MASGAPMWPACKPGFLHHRFPDAPQRQPPEVHPSPPTCTGSHGAFMMLEPTYLPWGPLPMGAHTSLPRQTMDEQLPQWPPLSSSCILMCSSPSFPPPGCPWGQPAQGPEPSPALRPMSRLSQQLRCPHAAGHPVSTQGPPPKKGSLVSHLEASPLSPMFSGPPLLDLAWR